MRNMLKKNVLLAAGALLMSLSLPLRADVIYDNSNPANDLHYRFDTGTNEIGDEILLGGTARYLTNFSFEYWGVSTGPNTNSFAGAVQAQVRFYEMDGPLHNGFNTPGTCFYDSGLFSVPSPTPRNTFVFTAGSDFLSGGLFIPTNDITWSVQFTGMGATDSLGVDIYCPPVVGTNYNDYWVNDPTGGWTLTENYSAPGAPYPGGPGQMNFGALMEGQIPEPSAMVLSLVGGLGIWGLTRRLRRKE